MPTYNSVIDRTDVGALIPEDVLNAPAPVEMT